MPRTQKSHISTIYILNRPVNREIVLVVAGFLGYFVFRALLSLPFTNFLYPDEKTYLLSSQGDITDFSSFGWTLLNNRVLFLLLIRIYTLIFGQNIFSIRLLAVFLSSLLVLITYLFGKIWGKKIGLVSSALLGFNPFFWIYSIRLMPEVPSACMYLSSFFFLIHGVKKGMIKWNHLIFSILLFILAYFIKQTGIILIPLYILYLIVEIFTMKVKDTKKRYLGMITTIIIFPFSMFYIMQYVFSNVINMTSVDYPLKWSHVFNLLSFFTSRPAGYDWYTFWFKGGIGYMAVSNVLYYTPIIVFFFVLGIFISITQKIVSYKTNFLFLSIILLLSAVASIHFGAAGTRGWDTPRQIIVLFPIISVYSAVGIINLKTFTKKYSYLAYLVLINVFLLIPLDSPPSFIPNNASFEGVVMSAIIYSRLISLIVLIGIIALTINENTYNYRINVRIRLSKPIRTLQRIMIQYVPVNSKKTIIIVLMVLSSSFVSGYAFSKNGFYAESYQIPHIREITDWVQQNIPLDSTMMTNEKFILDQSLDYKYNILDAPWNRTELYAKRKFIDFLSSGSFDYLILFSDSRHISLAKNYRPYLISLINEPFQGLQEIFYTKDKTVFIFKVELLEPSIPVILDGGVEFYQSYEVLAGGLYGINFSNDLSNKISGNQSLMINVTTGSWKKVGIYHTFETGQDWSKHNVISFHWFGKNSGDIWELVFHTFTASDLFVFRFSDDFYGWKKMLFLMDESQIVGLPNWNNVNSVYLSTYPSAIYENYLDDIIVDADYGSN